MGRIAQRLNVLFETGYRRWICGTCHACRVDSYQQISRYARLERSRIYGKTVSIADGARVAESKIWGTVDIGPHCNIEKARLAGGDIRIGRYSRFHGPGSDIWAAYHPVSIGNFCSIARGAHIQEFDHNVRACTTFFIHKNVLGDHLRQEGRSKGPICIGHDVWIGAQCIIGSGVNVGHGAVIGANSTVVNDVPPYAIVAGSPARVIRYRFDDDIMTRLLQLAWWDWPEERIKANAGLFSGDLTKTKLDAVV